MAPRLGCSHRIVGLARAKELVMLAERLSAEKALEWGLINQVHDDDKLLNAASPRRRI